MKSYNTSIHVQAILITVSYVVVVTAVLFVVKTAIIRHLMVTVISYGAYKYAQTTLRSCFKKKFAWNI